ncbi:pumilio homolog 2-like [Impatiens glandulifera]|uniref:pumilio homolog 2-like n=1 Tax=Impatiens glandulifera TaxID=253017 RepID=UPI001FB181D2|nr:pumilio homolog 2-like [Impatiens glandulifera]
MDEIDDSQNPGFPPPSPTKENWRNQYYAYRSPSGEIHYLLLSDFYGHLVKTSEDVIGSRFIKKKLQTATIEDKNEAFKELKPHALALMKDKFGSRVIKSFFEHGLDLQRKGLAEELFGNVYTLSLDQYGCRVIQKALELVDMDQKIKIVRELDNHVNTCLYDDKASHVIRKCVECVPEEHIGVIVSVCVDQIVKLAQHTPGNYILQSILKYCKNTLTQKRVIDGIVSSLVILANNGFGNYVVQCAVEHGKPEDRSKIVEKLAENIVEVSLNRFGSGAIQKCLVFGSHCDRKLILNVILGSTDRNEPLQTIVKGQSGKFVVRTLLKTCDDEQRELILLRIKIHCLEKYLPQED